MDRQLTRVEKFFDAIGNLRHTRAMEKANARTEQNKARRAYKWEGPSRGTKPEVKISSSHARAEARRNSKMLSVGPKKKQIRKVVKCGVVSGPSEKAKKREEERARG